MKKSLQPATTFIKFPTAIVDRVNFMAELPDDFGLIIRVCENNYPEKQLQYFNVKNINNPFNNEFYKIKENKIYFSGSFSRCWIIRIWQKWREKRKPVQYKIEYIPKEMYKQFKNETIKGLDFNSNNYSTSGFVVHSWRPINKKEKKSIKIFAKKL